MNFKRFLQALVMFAMLYPVPLWASALEKSLNDFFAQGIHYQGAKAELIQVNHWPNTKQALRWRMPAVSRHSKRISLIAEQGMGPSLRRWYVPVQLHWWANVVSVRQELPARTLLQSSMLQVQRRDIAGHMGVWWKEVAKLEGMRLTRPLHADDVVFSNAVKRPPLIKRGDRVTMIVGNGSFLVRAAGKAMKAAGLGERVLVQNMRSKKRVEAIVVDAHTVRVEI
ncbi:MAG: flagellar basal body P-ring formation chaperone FlgA [Mariprofundaceae bacterium]|nr:flagellar basal body P-ring formation chaperone FlgA [Mariprofundaceae bacterium]